MMNFDLVYCVAAGSWLTVAEMYGRVAHAGALLNHAVGQFIASKSKRPNRAFDHDLISFLDEMKENFSFFFSESDVIDAYVFGHILEKCMSMLARFAHCSLDHEGQSVNFVKVRYI